MVWKIFSSAPHRLYFFAGAVQGVLAIAWWFYDLLARYARLFFVVNWTVPSVWAHAFLMIYGFFPFFIFGFLMTVAPNWVNGEKVKRAHYVPGYLLMAAGIVMFYPALLIRPEMLAISIALYLAGWLVSAGALLSIVVASSARDKGHAYIVIGNVFIGWLGAFAYLMGLMGGNQVWLQGAVIAGIWLFLLPIFLSVSHRMIPFFSSTVLTNYEPKRPYAPLFTLLGGMIIHASLNLTGEIRYLWLIDLPMAMVAFYFSWLWEFGRSFSVRLLAMLHIGFAWLGIALTLYAVQSLIDFVSGRALLAMAPLHALTIGYFSSMVLAMVTRVTLGHSGHLLKANRTAWFLFLGFQFAALARILGDLPFTGAPDFYIVAAVIWLACFMLWDIKHLPIYWKQRIDRKQG
jgi:uncharacterized protein involved in response to NO